MEGEEYESLFKLQKNLNPVAASKQTCNKTVDGEVVKLNIAGQTFVTTTETLQAVPESLLAGLTSESKYYKDDSKEYFFDRDSDLFKSILNAHRDGEIHVPRGVCPQKFKREMRFWGIPASMLSPCCWHAFYETEDELKTLDTLVKNNSLQKNHVVAMDTKNGDQSTKQENRDSLRTRVWYLLDDPTSSTAAIVWCYIYITVVFGSAMLYMITTEEYTRVAHYITKIGPTSPNDTSLDIFAYNDKIILLLTTDPHLAMLIADGILTVFFVIENLVHLSVSPDKKLYFTEFYNCFKLFLAVVMAISFGLQFRKDLIKTEVQGYALHGLRSFNVLRLLMIFRLRKHYKKLHLLLLSLEHSCRELALLILLFIICIIIYGGMIFSAEITSNMFPNSRIAMWWALITMTTVGYGDYYPTQTMGYIVGFMCAINGLIVLALPVAAIAQNFSTFYTSAGDIEKHLEAIKKDKSKLVESNDSNRNDKRLELIDLSLTNDEKEHAK